MTRKLYLVVVALILVLATATSAQAKKVVAPPSWWVTDALCVHDAWHYTATWQKGLGRAVYHLFGVSYWRTWRVSPSLSNGEAAWTYNAGPQFGGMQMDGTFELNYGSEYVRRYGHAGNWPVPVQLLVAYRGWLVQTWGAWPNTSRACGL